MVDIILNAALVTIFLAFLYGCNRRSEIYSKIDLIWIYLFGTNKKPTDEELFRMKQACSDIVNHGFYYEHGSTNTEKPLETMTKAFGDALDETKDESKEV